MHLVDPQQTHFLFFNLFDAGVLNGFTTNALQTIFSSFLSIIIKFSSIKNVFYISEGGKKINVGPAWVSHKKCEARLLRLVDSLVQVLFCPLLVHLVKPDFYLTFSIQHVQMRTIGVYSQ